MAAKARKDGRLREMRLRRSRSPNMEGRAASRPNAGIGREAPPGIRVCGRHATVN
jgi:hypothetical protein